jgi:hypothetical protein
MWNSGWSGPKRTETACVIERCSMHLKDHSNQQIWSEEFDIVLQTIADQVSNFSRCAAAVVLDL